MAVQPLILESPVAKTPRTSDTQRETITRMAAAGGTIERWDGGFWTTPGMEYEMRPGYAAHIEPFRVPKWYVQVGTLRALESYGLLEVAENGSGPTFALDYRLTDMGRRAAVLYAAK